MQKKPASKYGIFNPRVVLPIALCSIGTLLAILSFASTPATSMVTVPSSIGQTVTVTWTGTIPPLTNASSNCAVLADTPAVDQHVSTITVPAGIYSTLSAKFEFKITWDNAGNDEILTVVGPAGEVGTSDGGNPVEVVAGQNLIPGAYKIIACGFVSGPLPQAYNGSLTITTFGPDPPPPPNYTSGAITFGPATVADFQRTEGEPLLHIDKDGKYWDSGPWGFSTTQSFMHRSTDGG
ncbi:MAG TPA: hypothetical protein VF511_05985, partial [Chthoniobacterales bacterium]